MALTITAVAIDRALVRASVQMPRFLLVYDGRRIQLLDRKGV